MKTVLIYNVKSGSGYNLRRLRQLFKSHDVVIEYSFTTSQLGSRKLANLIKRGKLIAVVGGDGTLNSVARLVVGTKSTMLPLPGGTFNHFVRDLGMAPDIESIIANLDEAKERLIDVGYVNDQLFLNNSNIGLYPFSLIERKATKRFIGKYAAAVLSAFDQIGLFRRHSLVIDGSKLKSPFVFVGNNMFDIKQTLIPSRTSFTKSVLTVMIATSNSRFAFIRSIIAVVRGDISRRNDFSVAYRQTMTIFSRESKLPVSFDGEVRRLTTPLEYSIKSRSLRVLVVRQPRT